MKCPYLEIEALSARDAGRRVCLVGGRDYGRTTYSPSALQLKEYCKKNEHKKCPFYVKAKLRADESFSRLAMN